MRKTSPWLAVFASLILVFGLFLVGCNWFDDDDDDDEIATTGFEFTSANMVDAGYFGTDITDTFSKIGSIFGVIVGGAVAGPAAFPLAEVPLGPSNICLDSVTDEVIWNDNDDNLLPSPGDTLEVFWDACVVDPVEGTTLSGNPATSPAVTFTVAEVGIDSISGTLNLNLLTEDPIGSNTFKGKMNAVFDVLALPSVEIIFGDVEGTAADTQIEIKDLPPGTEHNWFGCFDVIMEFPDINDPSNFTIGVRGIGKVLSSGKYQILQLGDYADEIPELMSFENDTPVSGQLKLLSFDSRPDFGLSSCYGVVAGTTSELVDAAVPGGGTGTVYLFTDISLPPEGDPWAGEPTDTDSISWLDGVI